MNRLVWGVVVAMAAFGEEAPLRVLYTGKLLGYGRGCDSMVLTERVRKNLTERIDAVGKAPLYDATCDGGTDYSKQLSALLKAKNTGNSLLVGVGNHFALDYGSRTVKVIRASSISETVDADELLYFDPGQSRKVMSGDEIKPGWLLRRDFMENPSKDRDSFLKDYSLGNVVPARDAVADWMVAAGYRATVPGKHDFYFGAEKLREISRLMAKGGLHMLGANMIIEEKRLDPPQKRLDYMRKRNYLPKHAEVKIKFPKKVLPWIRRIEVEGVKDTAEVVQAGDTVRLYRVRAEHPDTANTSGLVAREFTRTGSVAEYAVAATERALAPGSYHACLELTGPAKPAQGPNILCSVVQVEHPYFQYSPGPTNVRFPDPYVVDDTRKVVVMGVVLPGMEKAIGRISSSWLDADEKYDLRLGTTDAEEALGQLLDYCRDRNHCNGERRQILLAQMPASAARSLNVRLKKAFALVIAEANFETGTSLERAEFSAGYPALTVAPLPPYDPTNPGKLSVHVQEVVLGGRGCAATEAGKCAPAEKTISQGFQSNVFTIRSSTMEWELVECGLRNALGRLGLPMKAGAVGEGFKTLTLAMMRDRSKASVAIAQKRDFFEVKRRLEFAMGGEKYEEQLLGAVLGILWKGDFVVTRMVKGSALVKMMERSKTFDGEDESPYDGAVESGRGLEMLGMVQDPESEKWLVDGAEIEADKAYLVATTDFLGAGDTGYPEFAAEVAGPRVDRLDRTKLQRIWALVYGALVPSAEELNLRKWSTYLPYLQWEPFPTGKDPAYSDLLTDYFSKRGQPVPTMPGVLKKTSTPLAWTYEKPLENAETLTQWRPLWRLVVEKSSFALNRYAHNQGDQTTLVNQYDGMADSRVLAANSSTWGWEWAVEVRRERIRSVSFLRTEGSFKRSEIQSKTDNRFARNYSQNENSLEGGYRFSFGNNIRQTPWTGLLISGLWTTQVASPLTSIGVGYALTDLADGKCLEGVATDGKCKGSYDAKIGRTGRVLSKFGIRREGRDYWAEAGFTYGTVGRPIKYSVQGESGKTCDLKALSLSECLDGLTLNGNILAQGLLTQSSTRENVRERGVFLNFKWTIPVSPSGKKFIELTNRGKYFFDRDSDIWFDTRLLNVFTASFSVPVAGGLTFKPTWTLFHFQGKGGARKGIVLPAFVSSPLLMGNTIELKLDYSFDWRTGQSLYRAMKHGNGK